MSMIRCEHCDRVFDSDADPDCFVENPGLPGRMGDEVLCEWCREKRAEQDEAKDDAAERCIAMSERAEIF
jgi:hypothetical protein